jgi:Helitron helicase-like domain at N-terminus
MENLYEGQQPTDQLDLIAWVFAKKVDALVKDLKAEVLGPYKAHVYSIEY